MRAFKNVPRRFGPVVWGVMALLAGAMAPPAHGGMITVGHSRGFAIRADLTLTAGHLAVAEATLGPIADAQGNAPPAYQHADEVFALDLRAGTFGPLHASALARVSADLLRSTADSNVDGLPGPRTTSATNLILGLDGGVAATPLLLGLGFSATTIHTSASVTGDFGALSASGDVVLEDLHLTVLGHAVNVAVDANGRVAPNTTVDVSSFLGGVTLVLNEQTLSGDGLSSQEIAVNAIHLTFKDVDIHGVGTVNGEVIIGHADAFMAADQGGAVTAVPEPSGLVLAGLGLAGLVVARRRRKATAAGNALGDRP